MTIRMLGILLCSAIWMNVTVAAETEKATPLIRDVRTGYLLNCTFRAIRPYIWKEVPILTGWDTDARGGTWESSPSGFFPDSFAFHKDWFKLSDTSPQHAVTIRHQIARQTEGTITLEMRFMLSSSMEGAAWQLRDLDDVAVGLVVHEGSLCYETSGQAVPLVLLEPNHEYGIRIDANLDTKTAAIYVDGELKAQAVPFAQSVGSLDYVCIQTGDTSLGEMFLSLVRVSKGYGVCETFATCGIGRTPSDWDTKGPGCVETLRSASGPDVLSLKLSQGAEATRAFDPCSAKTVWEFRLLLPEKCDGAAAELASDAGSAGRILSADGHLCYVDAQGKHVPLVENYRANLWYAFKVVADVESGQAEVFINGKSICPAIEFSRPAQAFRAVRFAMTGPSVMWIDDVRVYQWQDYPFDYVPPPQPVARDGDHLLGVQSCSLWKEGDAYAGWGYVYPFAERRKPYLGWYDEGNPEVADWEIKWQVEHGIDFEQYCWYRPNDAINHPIKDGVLEQGIRDGLFNARYSALKKFTIMYTNQGAGDTNPDDWQNHIIPYWIEYFFKDPRYLKIEGKPVLAIYYPDYFLRDFGGVEGARRAIQRLREDCMQAGFPGVIVLMELRNANRDVMQKMKDIGIDYCYAYTWGTGDVNRQRQENLAQRDAAAAVGFHMLPSISMGWQTSPWDGTQDPGTGWASVSDYQALAQWAKDEFMPTLPQDSLGRRMLMLANWNEFGEGHFLMPSNLVGFGYVDALREVFTHGGPHDDPVPGQPQKRRFTALFPKE
ncbi:MAG: glycoside hydrolase family 99-like domain-containing protein [Pirellulaceae bacterium]